MDFRARPFRQTRCSHKPIPKYTPCGYCFERWAATWDHILPYSRGGQTVEDNLMPSCTRCNHLVGAKVFLSIEEKRDFVRCRLKYGKDTKKTPKAVAPAELRILPRDFPTQTLMAKVLFKRVSMAGLGRFTPARPRPVRKSPIEEMLDRIKVFELEAYIKARLRAAGAKLDSYTEKEKVVDIAKKK